MSTAAKLKKRAIELEQKKQFDKALSLYIQFLQESEGSLDDTDVPLYNRVGDLLLRTGNAADALNYYEKAVDLYAERGFLNNAIALCNKVLRQAPGRASIYYKLGKISATKGFKSDAKKNFLEYADRMQKAGQIDEAFRALKEFADLCPDQDDIRLMLAEQLSKENRREEALEQLQKLHDKFDSEGRTAEARATADRMKSIDPDVVPRVSGSYRPQKSNDLIFLDTSFDEPPRSSKSTSSPTPHGRQVSDPDLVVLTMGEKGDTPLPPVMNRSVADAFSLETDTPSDGTAQRDEETGSSNDLPLLDVDDAAAAPTESRADGDHAVDHSTPAASMAFASAGESAEGQATPDVASIDDVGTFELAAEPQAVDVGAHAESPAVDLGEVPTYESGPPLGIDYTAELATTPSLDGDASGNDLFDFRSPPRSDDAPANPADAPVALDPDVSFPALDLDDISLPSADDVTSGGDLAAALAEMSLGDSVTEIDTDVLQVDAPPTAEAQPAEEISLQVDAAALLEEAIAAEGEVAGDASSVADFELTTPVDAAEASPLIDDAIDVGELAPSDAADDVSDASTAGQLADITPPSEEVEFATHVISDADASVEHEATTVASGDSGSLLAIEELCPAEEETPAEPVPVAPPSEPPPAPRAAVDEWQVRRERAERLLESGDRAGGIAELEQMAADLERSGDLERAATIVDELIRLLPDSIRHHQKRVEFAFRSGDRRKLIDAYIELGDALFRSGEERKATAVYQRVLELAPDDPRVRVALDTVRASSPPAGSGAIATPPARPAPAAPLASGITREQPPRPASPPSHAATVQGNGVAAPSRTRVPSPLDRSAASEEFVDLGDWLRATEAPKSTRMVAEEKPPSGDEQADFQEMLKRFKQGVADNVDEEDYESHYDLGVAYKEMGLIDEAVAEFQKALRGTNHRVRAYEALGQCFVEKEQYQVATSVLSRAMALGEGDDHHLVGVLYLMGRAAEALDRPADALDYYQRVFAVDIEFRDVAERIRAIERKAT